MIFYALIGGNVFPAGVLLVWFYAPALRGDFE
jgi:hypothetical protein